MKFRLLLVAFAAFAVPACTSMPSGSLFAQSNVIPLEIGSRGKVHKFSVEVARTQEEQSRGLMFRESLAGDAGMLFPFQAPRVASFWMKDTLIPLDMIFIRADGTIARIAPETTPHSLDPVTSGEPVVAVLELAGGEANRRGIDEDDRVTWKDN